MHTVSHYIYAGSRIVSLVEGLGEQERGGTSARVSSFGCRTSTGLREMLYSTVSVVNNATLYPSKSALSRQCAVLHTCL